MTTDVSLGELSRSVANVLVRIEGIAQRLESGQFVRTDVYELQVKGIQAEVKRLGDTTVLLTEHTDLKTRVTKLEEQNTWLVRLVVGFVVTAILAFVFTQTGGAK